MSKVKNKESSAGSDVPEVIREPADGTDVLDWDACIEVAPVRPAGTIKVRLHYQGRDKPLPLEDPQDEKTPRES